MHYRLLTLTAISLLIAVYGCSGSSGNEKEGVSDEIKTEPESKNVFTENSGLISERISTAAINEQKNPMYSREEDSSYLYWLDNELIITDSTTKCNIFAMNVLYKAGFKCPDDYPLTYDLMDTAKFADILPVVKINSETDFRKGDLIIWNGHVIIFEYIIHYNDELYAMAWWAGTNQENNGVNIFNNVVHGRYPIYEGFIVRRPLLQNESKY
ncbi:MAG: hypothetical protein JNJ56_06345 [Ignavibacteria bacterium]|nr:hypothetical protein [Ignavibacteria bacterium]